LNGLANTEGFTIQAVKAMIEVLTRVLVEYRLQRRINRGDLGPDHLNCR
jgi:hypothetical protein